MAKDTKEYKRLSRQELLELLIEESEKTEELERQIQAARDELASRELRIKDAGSIAEAALSLNGVFEAVQAACDQYVENVKKMSSRQDEINAEREEESKRRAAQILNDANRLAQKMEADTRSRCLAMIRLTKEEILKARRMDSKDES